MTHQFYDQTGSAKKYGEEWESEMEITYVVYLIDGSGEEFFVAQEDELVRVNINNDQKPLVVKTIFQISAQLDRLRKKHSSDLRLFALEYGEFLERKGQLKN